MDGSASPGGASQQSGAVGTGGGDAAGVDSRAAWKTAWIVLALLSVSYGSPLLIVVGMRTMQEQLGTDRSVIALAGSLMWVGTGAGGILMGWLADRIGLRPVVIFGACMIAGGLALSATGSVWAVYVGHGLMVGLLGNGAVYPPLLVYVSRWFYRRRGAAIALISSGQYVAGVIWPALLELGMGEVGWQGVMLGFGAIVLVVVVPTTFFLGAVPIVPQPAHAPASGAASRRIAGLPPNVVQAMLCVAGFCCCIPMSIPQGHLVAMCGDIGIRATHGAAMLSVMLAAAFVSRQAWGALADRIGGLRTVLAGSACQAVAIAGFLLTQDEAGLFAVATVFGLGFSGIIPAYSVAIRDLFPAAEASWRIPLTLFTAMSGMAFGSWFAGALYDHFGYYAPAFAAGVGFNILNLLIVGVLVGRTGSSRRGGLWAMVR